MTFEGIENLKPDMAEARMAVGQAQRTVSECAEDAWSTVSSNDIVASSVETVRHAADSAWETCTPTLETAGAVIVDGARNGAYVVGRFGLGVADVVENAYIGVRSNVELIMGDGEAAVQTAQIHAIDDAADSWGDFMDASEDVREIGNYAEAGGEIATEVALGAAAMTAAAPVAVVTGTVLVASEMGKSLESNSADGEISQEDVVVEVAIGGITAATLLAGRGLNNLLASKAAASEAGTELRLTDSAGNIIGEGETLLPNSEYLLNGIKCNTDDLGQIIRVGDELVPEMAYELNGYKYATDSLGRITSAEGTLQMKAHEGRLAIKDGIDAIGKGFQEALDQRGHLIADRFNGSCGLENIVAMGGEVNQKAFVAIENKCAEALAEGAEVLYKVEPLYEGSSFRPSAFVITDIIDGEETITFLLNTVKGL